MGLNMGMGFGAGMGFGMGMGLNLGLGGLILPQSGNVAYGQPVNPQGPGMMDLSGYENCHRQ